MRFIHMLSERLPFFKSSRLLRYVAAGGTGAAANIAVLFVLTEFFHIWYLLSSVVAVCVGFAVSFILQKFWTFQNTDMKRVHVQLPMHLMLSLANLALNTVIVYALVDYAHLWYVLAQVFSGATLAFVNYFVYRTYIFKSS